MTMNVLFSVWNKPHLRHLLLWSPAVTFGFVFQKFHGVLNGFSSGKDEALTNTVQVLVSLAFYVVFTILYKRFADPIEYWSGGISLASLVVGLITTIMYLKLSTDWIFDVDGRYEIVGWTEDAAAFRKTPDGRIANTKQKMIDNFPPEVGETREDAWNKITSKPDKDNRKLKLAVIFSCSAPAFALTLIGLFQSDLLRRIGRRTVVELDLIGYSTIAAEKEREGGVDKTLELNKQIQGFVDAGLRALRAHRLKTVFSTAGDSALLVFSRPSAAHTFAQAVHQATREHNLTHPEALDKRVFRVGVASGDVSIQNLPRGGIDVVGTTIAHAVRLEAKANPGGVLVDRATLLGLPNEQKMKYGTREEIPGKRDEIFEAYRCSMYPEGSREIAPIVDRATKRKGDAPLDSPVPELLANLASIDLKRLMYLLNIPVAERPSATDSDEERRRVILAWAGQEQGRLEALKEEIIDLMSSGTALVFKNPDSGLNRPRECKILFLAANPPDGIRLSLDEESREIKQKILGSRYRDKIKFDTEWAVRPDDSLRLLNELEPDVVHFSGHGNESGAIVMVDETGRSTIVTGAALKEVFSSITKKPRLVFLNACFSRAEANEIKNVVGCTIGMNRAIGDKAAIKFAGAFYQAIGYGKSVQEAFDQGKAALTMNNIPEEMTPVLLCQDGLDPDTIVLA
jgi:class 3 adenylate cyclase